MLIDGSLVGVVRNGMSEDFSVEPGEHSVRLKLDWGRSDQIDVTISGGDVVQLRCGPRGRSLTGLYDALFRSGSYIRLETVES